MNSERTYKTLTYKWHTPNPELYEIILSNVGDISNHDIKNGNYPREFRSRVISFGEDFDMKSKIWPTEESEHMVPIDAPLSIVMKVMVPDLCVYLKYDMYSKVLKETRQKHFTQKHLKLLKSNVHAETTLKLTLCPEIPTQMFLLVPLCNNLKMDFSRITGYHERKYKKRFVEEFEKLQRISEDQFPNLIKE